MVRSLSGRLDDGNILASTTDLFLGEQHVSVYQADAQAEISLPTAALEHVVYDEGSVEINLTYRASVEEIIELNRHSASCNDAGIAHFRDTLRSREVVLQSSDGLHCPGYDEFASVAKPFTRFFTLSFGYFESETRTKGGSSKVRQPPLLASVVPTHVIRPLLQLMLRRH